MSDSLVCEVVSWRDEPRESTGWHIVTVRTPNGKEHKVTGCHLPRPGCCAELLGDWEDSKWGEQFHARSVLSSQPPLSAEGVELWLADRCDGIGKIKAAAIMRRFDNDPAKLWASLERGHEELAEVLGEQLAEVVREAYVLEGTAREHYATLRGWKLTQAQIARIIKHWPLAEACDRLYADPYLLAEHISGFGFQRADEVAMKCGIAKHSKQRVRAGILYQMAEMAQQGHAFSTYAMFVWMSNSFLGVSIDETTAVLQELIAAKRVVTPDGARIYLPAFERAEATAARCTCDLLSEDVERSGGMFAASAAARALAEKPKRELHPFQLDAIELMANPARPIGLITGGPGTGKTTILQYAVAEIEAQGLQVILAAPTGKAARRMAEATDREAMTLHRLLEYRPEYVVDCDTCKLSGGAYKRVDITQRCVIIVDEASMVDLQLWAALMGAVERGGNKAAVRFVGDADQLPPVGAGQPFADHLRALSDADAGRPSTVVRLGPVYRQGEGSWVAESAPLVLAGKMPDLTPRPDFRYVNEVRADCVPAVIENILRGKHNDDVGFSAAKLAAGYKPKRGFASGMPAPVLVPQNKGLAGVAVINRLLSEHFNPRTGGVSDQDLARIALEDGTELRVGARVLITKNDYKREVRNGDTGVIEHMEMEVDKRGRQTPITWVRLDADETTARAIMKARESGSPIPATPLIQYTFKQAREELQLGYAMTIHKSQGSQYPWVIVVCHSTHTRMLTRRLLYTALTRASEGVVLVGNRDGLQRAVGNANELPRNTDLPARLSAGLAL